MVAIIKTGNSIRNTFFYNENKVKKGVAECFLAVNYPLDLSDMTEQQRLNMLLKTAALHPDVKRNSVHISLNFAPNEQHSEEKLQQITAEYMDRIGFGDQPYLVYRHNDAGHPHIHIVTTKIRPDGTKIDTQYIGKLRSEPARKELEVKFGLVKAEDHKKQIFALKPIPVAKVSYGRAVTKSAITSVLDAVVDKYKYTSLNEFNAVLSMYNVRAEQGGEDTRTFKNGGLVYRVIDESGNAISAPIKASAFYSKPTLKYLQNQFLRNDVGRQQHKPRLKNCIDLAFRNQSISLNQLRRQLKMEGIHTVIRQSKDGRIYGITYIDHRSKVVFNGSDLGKEYSAKAIQERCAKGHIGLKNPQNISDKMGQVPSFSNHDSSANNNNTTEPGKGLLEILLESASPNEQLPYELRQSKKRRKRNSRKL